MDIQAEPLDSLSISLSMKNRSRSYNKFVFPIYQNIENVFEQAALSSGVSSANVKSIGIYLELCDCETPTPPYIGQVSRIDGSVGAGVKLKWFVNKDTEERTIQAMLSKPLLAILLGVFKTFDIDEKPFLKSLAGFTGWTEIVETVSSTDVSRYASAASSSPISMDEDGFWRIIEESKLHSSSNQQQEERMIVELSKLTAEDVREFAAIFETKMLQLYRHDLWAVAYIINHGCSDDGFTEFRAWLICRGRGFYSQSIDRPEFVGDQVPVESTTIDAGDSLSTCHSFDLVASSVYEKKTGYDMYLDRSRLLAEPNGDSWDEDELSTLFPSLCQKFKFNGV